MTNFKGAELELKRATRQLSQEDINSFCTKQEIIWKFNPPSASHMGGLWERMIRTIRKILCNLVGSTRLSDETLETFFCETESIINGRPITKMSSDISDAASLTPNHLLLLTEGTQIPPGKFGKKVIYIKGESDNPNTKLNNFGENGRENISYSCNREISGFMRKETLKLSYTRQKYS